MSRTYDREASRLLPCFAVAPPTAGSRKIVGLPSASGGSLLRLHFRHVIVEQRLADPAWLVVVLTDLADGRDLGGGSDDETLGEGAQFVGHDRTLVHGDA